MGELFQPTHLLLIGIVLFLLFGAKKLPELGKGLGEGLKGFKEGIKEASSMIKQEDVFLHVEETDDVSHKRAPREKVELLESVDKELMRNSKSFSDCRIAVIVDHGCSSVTGEHIVMKVPYAICEKLATSAEGKRFCEQESKCIQLGDLMPKIFP